MTQDPKPDIALLKRVLAKIDKYPERWEQHDYATRRPCGTAYCFAGWIAAMSRQKLDLDDGGWRTKGGRDVHDFARRRAGLTYLEASHLFSASNDRDDLGRIVARICERAEGFEEAS